MAAGNVPLTTTGIFSFFASLYLEIIRAVMNAHAASDTI